MFKPEHLNLFSHQSTNRSKSKSPPTSPTKPVFNSETIQHEAKNAAIKFVSQILQRPDQLDKVEQYAKRIERKKVMDESMLKSMIQTHLEGVNKGLTQLQQAVKDIKIIDQKLKEVKESYREVAPLVTKLKTIKEESYKYNQYATAMENLKHIFNVPEIIKKTFVFFEEGNLLHAHQCIMDLENSRDDLLFEMHKLPTTVSPIDINLIHRYYEEVTSLNSQMAKQLFLVADRLISTTRFDPTLVVTMVRIIEREERSDEFIEKRAELTGFLPPGRPKNLKERMFQVLTQSVRNSLEGAQSEDRNVSNVWLVKLLERIRLKYLDDLRVIKKIIPPCFPQHYNIFETMTRMYHDALIRRLRDLVESNLQGNEIITLLTWVNEYQGREILGHPDLQITFLSSPPLLDQSIIDGLEENYLVTLQNNVQEWMKNTVKSDSKDWYAEKEPDKMNRMYFSTQMPFILNDMCQQNIKVSEQVSQSLTSKVVHLLVNQMSDFSHYYTDALIEYHQFHLKDRVYPHFYIHYLVAIANNCQSFSEFMYKLRAEAVDDSDVQDDMSHSILQMKLNNLSKTLDSVADRTFSYLLEEIFKDLEVHTNALFTKEWMTNRELEGIIRATFEDYGQDFVYLKPRYYVRLVNEIEAQLTLEYLKGLFAKRYIYKSYEERKEASEKLMLEATNYIEFFSNLRTMPITKLGITDVDACNIYKSSLLTVVPPNNNNALTNANFPKAGANEGPPLPPKRSRSGAVIMNKLASPEKSLTPSTNALLMGNQTASCLTCLLSIAEILKMRDTSLLNLEVSGLVSRFKDITYDNLVNILLLREDLTRTEIKNILADVPLPSTTNKGNTSGGSSSEEEKSGGGLLNIPYRHVRERSKMAFSGAGLGFSSSNASIMSDLKGRFVVEPEKSIFARLNTLST